MFFVQSERISTGPFYTFGSRSVPITTIDQSFAAQL